uniref:Uncharacterized protein n=1 Tax=Rhipicephalus appendiculatus TaxID=34631 RepID=A0A131YDE8_RHIAP
MLFATAACMQCKMATTCRRLTQKQKLSDLNEATFESIQGMHFQARKSTHCRHIASTHLACEYFLGLSLSRELKHATAKRNKFHLPQVLDKAMAKSFVQNMHAHIT